MAPTWEESNLRDAALGRVQGACAMMHLYEVFPFGSKNSGLELWNSDIDVVILNVTEPSRDNLGVLQLHTWLMLKSAVVLPQMSAPIWYEKSKATCVINVLVGAYPLQVTQRRKNLL